MYDKTCSAIVYISFAAVLSGFMTSAMVSPMLKVERDGNVLFGYVFKLVYDDPESTYRNHHSYHLEKVHAFVKSETTIGETASPRNHFMKAAITFYCIVQFLHVIIIGVSSSRIFYKDSSLIRSIVGLVFLTVIIANTVWFSLVTAFGFQDMKFGVAGGYYDEKKSENANVHKSINIGFFIALISLVISGVGVFLVPYAASH